MNNKIKALSAAVVASLGSSYAAAQPFAPLDARSMAMGDTGVASAKIGTSALFNPALLSADGKGENIHIVLPNAAVEAYADEDAIDAFERIEDEAYIDNIEDASIRMRDSTDTDTQFRVAQEDLRVNAEALEEQLVLLDGKPFRIGGAGFASVSLPVSDIGLSFFVNVSGTVETAPNISACDRSILGTYISYFSDPTLDEMQLAQDAVFSAEAQVAGDDPACVDEGVESFNILASDPTTLNGYSIENPENYLNSGAVVAGVEITEYGIAIAKQFNLGGKDVSFGVTPKVQKYTSYYVAPTVQQLDDDTYDVEDELENSERDDDGFNIDAGMIVKFLPGDALTVGLTVRNLLSDSYKTGEYLDFEDNLVRSEFDIDTQVRAGLSWDLPAGVTIAADMDVTKNKPYFTGDDTQFLGVGAEWDVLNALKLRGGYRTNMANSDEQVFTAGLGLNIVAFYLDLSGQVGDSNAGAALQLGFAF